jgi:Fur family peroxide stress response transcriptional regulator
VINTEKSVRNTKQRKHMLELLQSTKSHPNAFWLYEKMRPAFPNLSLSTVYRNLSILETQGMVQRVACGGTFERYDADVSMHSHFYCKKCGCVYDICTNEAEKKALESLHDNSHQLEGCHITYYGVCQSCKDVN